MVDAGTTSLLLSSVEKWQVNALNDLASTLTTANNDTFQAEYQSPKKCFTDDGGASWQGAARDTAYNRVGEDEDQARKVWTNIDDLINGVKSAASDIDSHRTALLGKIGDARDAGLNIADNWVVAQKDGVDAQTIQTHQDAINSAYNPFRDAVANACTKISEAAELIRGSGPGAQRGREDRSRHPADQRARADSTRKCATEVPGDGASVVDDDIAVAVISNAGDPGPRRSTAAHELAHMIFGDDYSGDPVMWRAR